MGQENNKTPDEVVKVIKELVAKHNQSGVARLTGLTQPSVGRYSRGVGMPSVATLRRLANYTGKTFIIEVGPDSR